MNVFPVIKAIRFINYELYPGAGGGGLNADFRPGVNIIAGVNGLGKTTFLNALYRCLSGPNDVSGLGSNMGNNQLTITNWPDRRYFAHRVSDEATDAKVELEMDLSGKHITIVRRLSDLKLESLKIDDTEDLATEKRFQELILELTKLDNFVNFLLLLRFVVFFLEDRLSAIWDRKAMDELLIILFRPQQGVGKYYKTRSDIRQADSERRNHRNVLLKEKSRLEKAEANTNDASGIQNRIENERAKLAALDVKVAELETRISTLKSEIVDIVERAEREKISIEGTSQKLQISQENYFKQTYPDIGKVANYVLVNLGAGGGCLVCGCRDTGLAENLEQKIRANVCPVCDAKAEHHENLIPTEEVNQQRIRKLAARIEKRRVNLRDRETELSRLNSEKGELDNQRHQALSERRQLSEEIENTLDDLPPDTEEMNKLRNLVGSMQEENYKKQRHQDLLEEQFKKLQQSIVGDIVAVSESIKTHFQQFVSHFLSESCELRFEMEENKIAQESNPLEFPRFTVYMTSATSEETLIPRKNKSEVSESQAEFIDLSFRMALIRALEQHSGKSIQTTFVLETPEASLDSVYIARAGEILRKFIERSPKNSSTPDNRLIVTTNLNKEDMIPALFGFPSEDSVKLWKRNSGSGENPMETASPIAPDERNRRVLNLVDQARPNAAVREFMDAYKLRYEQALDPDWAK